MKTMNIGGREYPVVGFVEDKRFWQTAPCGYPYDE